MRYFTFVLLFAFLCSTGQGAVKTWNGSVDNRWDLATNWTPAGVPADGDHVILDATGINTNITQFTSAQLTGLTVSNASGAATYSLSSLADGILGITGAAGTDLVIQSGCSLTLTDHIMFTLGAGCTADIAGSLTFSEGSASHLIIFSANSTTTLSGNLVFTGTGPGATVTIQYGALIEGNGSITHTLGAMTVDGFIEIEGNVNNAAPITGTGTIKTGGSFNNTSTLFDYPGNPPGEIISGYTWKGTTSTAWETASNWWAGAVPVSTGDAVIYPATYLPEISTAAQQCRRLYIHNEFSAVTISPAGQLKANGKTTLISDEGTPGTVALTIKSDAAGTGSFIDNGSFAGVGVASVERFLEYGTSGQWHFMCVPVTQINAWTYFDQYMKHYDESTHHYKYVIAFTDSLLNSDGLGYAMWANLTDFTAHQNGIPNTGTMIIPVSRHYNTSTSDYDGWNLVGNPYTSAVNLASLTLGWNNTDATAWFWDGNAGNFKVWPSGGAGTHSQFCPAGQAFFVHCNDPSATPSSAGSGFVVMNNSARVHNAEAFLKDSGPDIVRIIARGAPNNFSDELCVYFSSWVTEGYDPGYDAEKLAGDELAPQISTRAEGRELSVNALPVPQGPVIVPLMFTSTLAGSYMLTASELETFSAAENVYLEDTETGVVQDLRKYPVYTFSHDPSDAPDRFLLRFSGPNLGTGATGTKDPVAIYASGGEVVIANKQEGPLSGKAYVTDILGRTLCTQNLSGQAVVRLDFPHTRGYYIVTVVTSEAATVRRVYLD